MPHTIEEVQPGDLIEAAFFNRLLEALRLLDDRVTALESVGSETRLVLLARIPGGPYRVGDELQLVGRNFQHSIGAARVFVNTSRAVLDDDASNDERLVFDIPPVRGLSEAGTEVELRVLNQTQSVTETVVLRPAEAVLTGNVDVSWQSVDRDTIEVGQPVTFEYAIRSRASAEATFSLRALVSGIDNLPLWQSRIELLDSALNPLRAGTVRLAPREETTFHVRISSVPTRTEGESFGLEARATSGGVEGSSGVTTFEVGAAVEPPDPTILITPALAQPPGRLDGNRLTLPAGSSSNVFLDAEFSTPGDQSYDVSAQVLSPTRGWTVSLLSSPRVDTPPLTSRLFIRVEAGRRASAEGSLELRVQRRGESASRAFTLDLARAADPS